MKNKFSKIFEDFKFILHGHILNPIWLPRVERRRRRFNVNLKHAYNAIKKYKPFIESLKLDDNYEIKDIEFEYIFTIWLQSEIKAPALIKSCFQRMRKYYGDKVKVLDSQTLREWIELPDYIWRKWKEGKISNAHFTDICRVVLLEKYGGIWFDATDYLTSPIPEWIWESDFFMFSTGENISPTTLIQNCFIRSKKGYPLLKAWEEIIFEYWDKEDQVVDYFVHHYLFRYLIENNLEAAGLFSKMPIIAQDPTHLLWFTYRDKQFSEDLYENVTKNTFFQKTNFKMKSAKKPKPDTIADFMINGRIK